MDGTQYTTLMDVFTHLPDPRKRKGRRYPWPVLLGLIAAAMASACHTPAAIARWIREHRDGLLQHLPPTVTSLPHESTVRRTLTSVGVEGLEQELSQFHAPPPPPAPPDSSPTPLLGGLALDGKALRGVGRDGHPCHLVSLVTHAEATVVAQVAVAQKRDERSAVPALVSRPAVRGQVVTLDALHTLRPTARLILAHGGHYLMIVKKNQGVLYEFLDLLFTLPAHPADREVWDQIGPTTTKGHGRLETRTVTCGNAHIEDVDWPGVQQVARRICERTICTTERTSRDVTYAITSLAPHEAGAADLERLWRGHWTIENRVHYVRDVSFGEDASHAAQGNTAHVLAALRNALMYLFRRHHWRSIPAALAHYGTSVQRSLTLVGLHVRT